MRRTGKRERENEGIKWGGVDGFYFVMHFTLLEYVKRKCVVLLFSIRCHIAFYNFPRITSIRGSFFCVCPMSFVVTLLANVCLIALKMSENNGFPFTSKKIETQRPSNKRQRAIIVVFKCFMVVCMSGKKLVCQTDAH